MDVAGLPPPPQVATETHPIVCFENADHLARINFHGQEDLRQRTIRFTSPSSGSVTTFQSCTVLSQHPVITVLPSGLNATDLTRS